MRAGQKHTALPLDPACQALFACLWVRAIRPFSDSPRGFSGPPQMSETKETLALWRAALNTPH